MSLPLDDLASAGGFIGEKPAAKATTDGAIAPSDWKMVRDTVAATPASDEPDRVAWTNPATGTSGIIEPISYGTPRKGQPCRTFEATMTTIEGVRKYRGEACRLSNGQWALFEVRALDKELDE